MPRATKSEPKPKPERKVTPKSRLKIEVERVAKRTGLSVIFIRKLLTPIKVEQKQQMAAFKAAQAEDLVGRLGELVSQRLNEIASQSTASDEVEQ